MNLEKLLEIVRHNSEFIETNNKALEIYEGDLHKYIHQVMKKTLSDNYFNTIKNRIIPINVLTRIIEKLSKVYAYPVERKSSNHQDFVDEMVKLTDLDSVMLDSEEYSHLFKGYLLEPFLDDDDMPKVRSIPYSRFIPVSWSKNDPMKMTGVIKLMGKGMIRGKQCDVFHFWSDENFIPFTDEGLIYEADLIEGVTDFSNPIGFLPFVYGNRAKSKLVPTPDSDLLKLTEIIPVVLSDLGGAIMYQCFTILYGIDVKGADFTISPNAFWNIKSDPKSEKQPEIGSIKPEVDVNKVLDFIRNIFILWVETKGIRVGSMGTMDAASSASGISKIIDEMDTSEIRKKSSKKLKKEEKKLWSLMAKMNNYWIESVPEYRRPFVDPDTFDIQIDYTDPKPNISRKEVFESVHNEFKEGYLDARSAIERLYPDLDETLFEERVRMLEERSMMPRFEFNEVEGE